MLSKSEIINSKRRIKKPDDNELRKLPYKNAFVYGRVSSPEQVRDSKESIREIAMLVKLAKEDGFKTRLDPTEVEEWLNSITRGTAAKGVMEEGQVTIDVRDLGISGQLSADARKGMANLQGSILAGKVGAVYVTEGVSRLSRDRDRILPFVLLKQLKEFQVRLRTPEGVWNPAIERDWEYLADEFDAAIGELKIMNKRLQRRKSQKAARGEFVGEPVPPGFILPVIGRKANGEYEYGKMQPYAPHAEIDEQILKTYVNNAGNLVKTMRSVKDLVYPFFPPELSYMDRLSSMRRCKKLADGYEISPKQVIYLATNLKIIGVWQWGDNEAIPDNHPPAVPEELFLEAFQIAARTGKSKGRAAGSEPQEWSGLLYCYNHTEPRRLVSRNKAGYYSCERDYKYGKGPRCFYKQANILDKPLSRTVLSQLELDACIEEILSRMESDAASSRLDQIRERQQITSLEKEIGKLKALLPCCVDENSGLVDREKESYYWEQIRVASRHLEELRSRPAPRDQGLVPDYAGLRNFLKSLPRKWDSFSGSLRNRFLKALIDRVDLKGKGEIEATIQWKAGFQQKLMIQLSRSLSLKEKRWTTKEEKLLTELFSSSPRAAILTALPGRSWKSISLKAMRLKIKRERGLDSFKKQLFARDRTKPKSSPESQNLIVLQELPSGTIGGCLRIIPLISFLPSKRQ